MCSAQSPRIHLIATDVDGTLLNSKQELTPAVEQAIKKAADIGVPVISLPFLTWWPCKLQHAQAKLCTIAMALVIDLGL